MNSLSVSCFSLQHTIESGQFFLYEKCNDLYYITTPSCVFAVQQKNNILYYGGIDEKELQRFLGLQVPYNEIISSLSRDAVLKKYVNQYAGLRVMRLDPWQCLVSFLCSSAANIPKIKRNVQQLAQQYGRKTKYDGRQFFLFPQHGSLRKEVKRTGVGFRAAYIEAANALPLSFFLDISQLSYAEAKQRLCALPGIGEKIANCILLFGYHRWEAFPIDVWMQRVLQKKYGKKNFTLRQLQLFVPVLFPHYPGYAQQFLYHGFRQEQHALK